MSRWYHAGAQSAATGGVLWSSHSRRTKEAAESEARKMARAMGGAAVGIVETWDGAHGPRPGWDVADHAWEVRS